MIYTFIYSLALMLIVSFFTRSAIMIGDGIHDRTRSLWHWFNVAFLVVVAALLASIVRDLRGKAGEELADLPARVIYGGEGEKKMTDLTFIYSSPSAEALENLIGGIATTFGIAIDIDEMFYYGVFCKADTYANYDNWDEADASIDIPTQFTSLCSTSDEKTDYVNMVIEEVLTGEMEKPAWMQYVEEEASCGDDYDFAPSTFLVIKAKDEKYEQLAELLINFLYSPNMMSTFVYNQ